MSSSVAVVNKNYIINNESMSGDVTSDEVKTYKIQHCTIYVWWANGTAPIGEIRLEANVAPKGETEVWKEMTLSSTLSVTGNTGNLELNILEPLSHWRIKYVRTSGDADLYATWEGKSKG